MKLLKIALAVAVFAALFVSMADAQNATVLEFRGKGVLTLEQEKGGYMIVDKYVVDKSSAEAVIRFENGTEYNVTSSSLLRAKKHAFEGDIVSLKPIKHNASSKRRFNPHRMSSKVLVSNHQEDQVLPAGVTITELDYPRVAPRQVRPAGQAAPAPTRAVDPETNTTAPAAS